MLRQKMKTFVAMMLALVLFVSINVSAYSLNETELTPGGATPTTQQDSDLPVIDDNADGDQKSEDTESSQNDGEEQQEQQEQEEEGEKLAPLSLTQADAPGMTIQSVEIVNAGDIQAKYREDISLEGNKYYTSFRDASMLDPRIFNIKVTVSKGDFTGIGEGEGKFNIKNVVWFYGDGSTDEITATNKPIAGTGAWTKELMGNSDAATKGQNPIKVQEVSAVEENADGDYTFTAKVLFDTCFPTEDSGMNIPYKKYTTWQKANLMTLNKLMDKFRSGNLKLVYDGDVLASTAIRYNIRDYYHTWKEFDDYIKNEVIPGSDNAGDGSFADGRYLSVQSLGKSNGYNDGNEINGGAPVQRDIWSAVLSDSSDSIEYFQNVIQPTMMTNPGAVDKDNANFRMPIYFNNIHADETPGMDAVIKLMEELATKETVKYNTTADANTQHVDKSGKSDYGYTKLKDTAAVTEVELNVDELLKKFIIVFTFCENPDGRYLGTRTNAYGFDPNRDSAYQTQIESQYSKANIAKWDPLAMLEFHGFYKQLLIEPCTPPHDPNLEYDLIQEPMLKLVKQFAKAAITEGAYNRFSIVVDDYNSATGSFDDGSAMYSPIYALHYGTLGYTYETPHGNIEDVLMMEKASYAMLGELYAKFDDYVDNKLEYKRRGVANEDRKELVDKYFQDYFGNVVGRPRDGDKSFFPEYYIIPTDNENQYNVLEAYNMVKYLTRNQVMVEKTTAEVTVDGKTYPAGTYIVNMHQGNRDIANTVLSPGFDASTFSIRPYAELIMSFPQLRGLDAIPIHTAGVFTGKTTAANYNENNIIAAETAITTPQAVVTGTEDMVVVTNNNHDVIKMVVKALKAGKEVYMLSENVEGKGVKGDFYMTKADFNTYSAGLYGEAQATAALEADTIKLIKMPKFTVYGSASESAFVFEKLGFVRNQDFFYKETEGVNSVVTFNNDTDVTAKLKSGLGLVAIGKNSVETARKYNYVGYGLTATDKSTGTGGNARFEALVKGTYSDDSMVTPHYNRMDTMYTVNSYYINAIPNTAKVLMKVASDNRTQNAADYDSFFIAGWSYNNKANIQGSILAAEGNYLGDSGKAHVTLFANNIINKAHNQSQYNMLANALFLAAAPYCEAVRESATTKSLNLKAFVSPTMQARDYLWEVKTGEEWTSIGTSATVVHSDLKAGREYTFRLTVTDINGKTFSHILKARTRSNDDYTNDNTTTGGTTTGNTTTGNTGDTGTKVEIVNLSSVDTTKESTTVKVNTTEASDQAVGVNIPTQNLTKIDNANKDFTINIETSFCTYALPASIVSTAANFDSLIKDAKVSANDTSVKVTMQNTESEVSEEDNEFKLSYDFKVELVNTKTGKIIGELNNFSKPVSRTVYLPKEIKALPEVLGVFRYNPETKTTSFVRHKAELVNGKPAVTIVSQSNSTYIVTNNKVTFTDVANNFWGKELIDTAATKGLVNGMGNGIYEPNKDVTRAEFTQMLINALDCATVKYETAPYSDVAADKYYFQAVSKAKELGLIKFATDKFEPNRPISREEMASMLSAVISINKNPEPQDNALTFNDAASINTAYTNDVKAVTDMNIMNGTGGNNFSPKETTTRAQAAAVLVRMCKALGFIG